MSRPELPEASHGQQEADLSGKLMAHWRMLYCRGFAGYFDWDDSIGSRTRSPFRRIRQWPA